MKCGINRKMLIFDFSFVSTILIILACLISVFVVLRKSMLVSICFAFTFVVIFAYLVLQLVTKNKFSFIATFIIVISSVNIIIEYLTSSTSVAFEFEYIKKLIFFLEFIILLIYSDKRKINNNTFRWIEILPVLAGIFLICSYFFFGNNEKIANAITLGFVNPNFTGMWLLHYFFYTTLYILNFRMNSRKRLCLVPLLGVYLYLINLTKARSCLIGIIVFFLLLFGKKFLIKFRKIVCAFCIIFPLVFAILYDWFVNSIFIKHLFMSWISEGKALDSRSFIWKLAINAIIENPIFGNYSRIEGGDFLFSHLHNIHLDVLGSYGMVPFILFMILLYKVSYIKNKNYSFYQYSTRCCFYAVLMTSTFEAAIVSGATGLNILTIGFLILSNYQNDDIKSKGGKLNV